MSLTDPVPPVPQHTPPVEEKSGLQRFTTNWMQWFLQLRDKVNVINESLVSLGLVTDPGILAKQSDGSWAVRTIAGTTDRITVSDGDGSGNPTIDIANEGVQDIVAAMLQAGTNITLDYNDTTGQLTINATGGGGGGGGGGNFVFVDEDVAVGAVSELSITGLDLDTDESYYIEYGIKSANVGGVGVHLEYNNDTTNTNYYSQQFNANGGSIGTSRINAPTVGDVSSTESLTGQASITEAPDGYPRAVFHTNRQNPSNVLYQLYSHIWNSTTNVTSLKLVSSVASGFATGSYVRVWKRTKVSSGGGGGGAGSQIGYAYTETSTPVSGSIAIPLDNTIPQITEGNAWAALDTTITPTAATSLLEIEVTIPCVSNQDGNSTPSFAIFRDGGANAVFAGIFDTPTAGGYVLNSSIRFVVAAGSVSATTFSIRYGNGGGTNVYMLQSLTNQFYGGVMKATMTIREIAQ